MNSVEGEGGLKQACLTKQIKLEGFLYYGT